MVSSPRAFTTRTPVMLLPRAVLHSPEAREEMLRIVRGRFPDRMRWPELMVEIIRTASFAERARFCGDEGGMDYELIYWAMREAESTDLASVAKWSRFKTATPFRLNVTAPPIVELSQIPPGALPPGVNPPQAC
ncbi:hypothetical protein D1007_59503 [Hordeum vulgare]|nr:hypothetical protein D1007_59503 [Hordeum vulgare]